LAKENSFSNFRTTNLVVISFHEVLKKNNNNKLNCQLKATKSVGNTELRQQSWQRECINVFKLREWFLNKILQYCEENANNDLGY